MVKLPLVGMPVLGQRTSVCRVREDRFSGRDGLHHGRYLSRVAEIVRNSAAVGLIRRLTPH